MAELFQKAFIDVLRQQEESSTRPNKASNVYACCKYYWLPIPERMWTGDIEFQFIANWAEDVEVDFTEDDDINISIKTSSTRPATRPTSSINIRMPTENWDNELMKLEVSSSWDMELFTQTYLQSFYGLSNLLVESWEADCYTEQYMKSFGGLYLMSFKECWDDELLF